MMCRLSDICDRVRERVDVSSLTVDTYISTENMLPNRGGITQSSCLPTTGRVSAFREGDVLLSNIGPYLRKLWFARYHGGCSNDVLVFRAKEGICPKFIFYLLSSDAFHRYSMATVKGTTIPRCDASVLMEYEARLFPFAIQEKIAAILGALDDKIELNLAINRNLEEQAKAIYKSWFIDYEPFDGKMPDDWSEKSLSEIAEFVSGYSYKGSELKESSIAMATIKNFDRRGGFKLDGYKEIIPSSKLKQSQHADLFDTLVAHTDITQNAEVIGNAEPVMCKMGYADVVFSMDLVKVVPKNPSVSKFLLAAILRDENFKMHCLKYVNGTTVLHLSKRALPEYTVHLPDDLQLLKPLVDAIEIMYKQMANNFSECLYLESIRDTLLPRLMSGEPDVSECSI